MDQIKETEEKVLKVFQAENPSNYGIDGSKEAFLNRHGMLFSLFQDKLNFPVKMFDGASLVDVGAGTGDNTIYYNNWGADCTLVEVNPVACERARFLYESYGNQDRSWTIEQSSLFDYQTDRRFDIVVSTGVIHHTATKDLAFDRLASLLRPGGFLYLAVSDPAGYFQRNLQRLVLWRFAKSVEDLEELAMRLFGESIERAAKFGNRSKRAVIYDVYVNPKIDSPTVAEVLGWFRRNRMKFYSTWPRISPLQMADSPMNSAMDAIMANPAVGIWPEILWCAHDLGDERQCKAYLDGAARIGRSFLPLTAMFNDMSEDKVVDLDQAQALAEQFAQSSGGFDAFADQRAAIAQFTVELIELFRLLRRGGVDEVAAFCGATERLFRGTNGTGMVYWLGYKE
ncbi:MAG: class I SAM-dependent methyltransferase [Phaeospirillum sp.]|nr:class I SAM-dependent methyltransferase [Phaeospirillum sp.]